MKKYGSEITIGLIITIIVIPMAIVGLLDVKLFSSVEINNDWIGFWGGYLGAIIGGIVTLLVMYISIKDGKQNLVETFRFEERKAQKERRSEFNDELLNQLVSYHTSVELYAMYLRQRVKGDKVTDAVFIEKAEPLVRLGNIIVIKLESKKNNPNYLQVQNLLDAVKVIPETINDAIEYDEASADLAKKLIQLTGPLIEEIESYYAANEN